MVNDERRKTSAWRWLWASVIAYIPVTAAVFLLSRRLTGDIRPGFIFWFLYMAVIGLLAMRVYNIDPPNGSPGK